MGGRGIGAQGVEYAVDGFFALLDLIQSRQIVSACTRFLVLVYTLFDLKRTLSSSSISVFITMDSNILSSSVERGSLLMLLSLCLSFVILDVIMGWMTLAWVLQASTMSVLSFAKMVWGLMEFVL